MMVEASLVNIIETVGILTGVAIALVQIQHMNKTRTAELYMSVWDRWNTSEFNKHRYQMYNLQYENLADWYEKCNPWTEIDSFSAFNSFGRTIGGLGELRRKGLIDIDFLDGSMLTDIVNWWATFGVLEKEFWGRGNPGWPNLLPFVKEVVDYDRDDRPWRYNEKGDFITRGLTRGREWVKPEEIDTSARKKATETEVSQTQ